MRPAVVSTGLALTAAGIVLIAVASSPDSIPAVVGYSFLAQAFAVFAVGSIRDSEYATIEEGGTLNLSERRRRTLKIQRDRDGLAVVVRRLRREFPHLTMLDAARIARSW